MDIIVIKRDGREEIFNADKIFNAIQHSFKNTIKIFDPNIIKIVTQNSIDIINSSNKQKWSVEEIQDIVEKQLSITSFEAAKHYILYRQQRNEHRDKYGITLKDLEPIDIPWGEIGYITYKRTYSRRLNEDDPLDDSRSSSALHDSTEEYEDTIMRVLSACQNQLHVGFTKEELKKAREYFLKLKCSVAGRFLWQLGTKTVDKYGLASTQNCAFVVIDSPIRPFTWAFDMLMLGSGVGFNIQKKFVKNLPNVLDKDISITRLDTKDADFIIPDSREGWVRFLKNVLESFFYNGESFTYSTILIRSKGVPIKGFGGVSSGPEDLCSGIHNICEILQKRKGLSMRSIDCLDIMNIIGTIVVSGNVRRCLPKNSLVHTKDGLINIQDINIGDFVRTSKGYDRVVNTFIQGKQKLVKIITEDGEFKCTPNHKMAVYKGVNDEGVDKYEWIEAAKLTDNDFLINPRKSIPGTKTELPLQDFSRDYIEVYHSAAATEGNQYTEKIMIDNTPFNIPDLDCDMAWFLGLFISSQRLFGNDFKTLSLLVDYNKDIIEKVKTQFKRFGDHEVSVHINTKNTTCIFIVNVPHLALYFDKNILHINCRDDEELPNFIKEATKDIRLAFIAGVLDGYMEYKFPEIPLSLTQQIQTLCYSCGFETRIVDNKIVQASDHSKYILSRIPYYIKATKDFDDIDFDESLLHAVKVINVEYLDEEEETFDIEVRYEHEFFCNGYLTHNSAQISLGDPDDIDYLRAKRWDLGNIPNWRAMSNNSVVCSSIDELPEEFWEGYKGNGEPYGLINIELSKKIGRIADGDKYPDPDVEGYNPCGEISLPNKSVCCLSEIFLQNVDSLEEMIDIAKILYRICKHVLLLKCHNKDTEDIVHKEMRIGLGVTGYLMVSEEKKQWLPKVYEELRKFDIEYSDLKKIPKSIKLTSVKPSGTLSLLAGSTPGCHSAIYRYFIRRIRISSTNPLVQVCKDHGFKTEYQLNFDGTHDYNTIVAEFPCSFPDEAVLAENMTVIKQLEVVKRMQTEWSDNAVSVTCYYKLEELEEIKQWLRENFTNNVKSVSFLLHYDSGFKQMPYEEITKEKYLDLKSKTRTIKSMTYKNQNIIDDIEDNFECAGGHCPIK